MASQIRLTSGFCTQTCLPRLMASIAAEVLAARLEGAAQPGQILLSAETVARTREYFEVRALGARSLQGIEEPVELLELLGAGGSDHPMTLLEKAGVDLSQPETVDAVVGQLDSLVSKLEALV